LVTQLKTKQGYSKSDAIEIMRGLKEKEALLPVMFQANCVAEASAQPDPLGYIIQEIAKLEDKKGTSKKQGLDDASITRRGQLYRSRAYIQAEATWKKVLHEKKVDGSIVADLYHKDI
jgi:hypothetical protein